MPEIIASILAKDPAELSRQARLATMAGADWLEIRTDWLPTDLDPAEILGPLQLPVLVACRTSRDGGHYAGTMEDRRASLQRWVDAGVDGIDLENWEDWVPHRVERLPLVIRSYHNLTGVDDNLVAIRDHLLAMGAHVAKIAVTAHDLADAAPVLDLLGATDQSAAPTVAFAMGEDAWPTRVLACAYGARFAYASVGVGFETAPGQVSVRELAGLYDVGRLSSSTSIYGVLGNPVGESWSPMVHNRAFRRLGHDAIYLPFTTAHPETTVAMLSRRRLRGLSVTAPHKTALLPFCHQLDDEAVLTGAINTLTFQAHGVVSGHNTDVLGVRDAFERAGLTPAATVPMGASGVVIGGGGAARAAAIALAGMGMAVTMMPRSLDPVRAFERENSFQMARLDAGVLAELAPRAVVHATPVGGPADPEGVVLPDWRPPAGTFVLDMIYQVLETPLLRRVKAAGGVPVPGVAMFLAQAREQIQHFVGARPEMAELAEFIGGAGAAGVPEVPAGEPSRE